MNKGTNKEWNTQYGYQQARPASVLSYTLPRTTTTTTTKTSTDIGVGGGDPVKKRCGIVRNRM